MITVDQALELILERAAAAPPVQLPLAETLDSTLAEDIASDVDSPPYDKAMVDGYAVIQADLAGGPVELEVLEEVAAGAVPTRPLAPGKATRIMTGAPVPPGAQAVVMVEQTEAAPAAAGAPPSVKILDTHVGGGNIMLRASSLEKGRRVLAAGTVVRPIEVGLLAEVGRAEVSVHRRPTVAVLATGNELVTPDVLPGPGQIRNSNGPMLLAQAARAGARPIDLGIGRDDRHDLADLVARGLRADVLVLSGGVSAGDFDLVPQVLAEAGVKQVFHKVHLKPGKPLWFGVQQAADRRTLVFGLPGNPVSSLVCFELFVRPALGRLAGDASRGLQRRRARLQSARDHRGDRPTYFPARLHEPSGRAADNDAPQLEVAAWKGSADLAALCAADCLAYFPPGPKQYQAGDGIDAYPF